jgi:hypothetical protein
LDRRYIGIITGRRDGSYLSKLPKIKILLVISLPPHLFYHPSPFTTTLYRSKSRPIIHTTYTHPGSSEGYPDFLAVGVYILYSIYRSMREIAFQD